MQAVEAKSAMGRRRFAGCKPPIFLIYLRLIPIEWLSLAIGFSMPELVILRSVSTDPKNRVFILCAVGDSVSRDNRERRASFLAVRRRSRPKDS